MKKQMMAVLISVFISHVAAPAYAIAEFAGMGKMNVMLGGSQNTMQPQMSSSDKTEAEVVAGATLSEKNATGQIEVEVGRDFSMTLASNATTGYHWELAAALDEAIVKLVSSTYQAPKTGLIGAGGQEIWTFKAVGLGETVIRLNYVRPWEKDATPAETASYKVTVR